MRSAFVVLAIVSLALGGCADKGGVISYMGSINEVMLLQNKIDERINMIKELDEHEDAYEIGMHKAAIDTFHEQQKKNGGNFFYQDEGATAEDQVRLRNSEADAALKIACSQDLECLRGRASTMLTRSARGKESGIRLRNNTDYGITSVGDLFYGVTVGPHQISNKREDVEPGLHSINIQWSYQGKIRTQIFDVILAPNDTYIAID